jgi:hypothetical protein
METPKSYRKGVEQAEQFRIGYSVYIANINSTTNIEENVCDHKFEHIWVAKLDKPL